MPILKAPPKPPRTTPLQLRLDDEARHLLTRYAEYLDCSPSYVVSEALKLLCRKDRDFQSWLAAHPDTHNDAAATGPSAQPEKN